MPFRLIPFLFLLLLATLVGCETEPLKRVDNNVPPPDTLYSSEQVNLYVNKLYINLLGRKPLAAELSQALTTIGTTNLSPASRTAVFNSIVAKPEYALRVFDILRADHLNNIDTNYIKFQIAQQERFLSQNPNSPARIQIEKEIAKAQLLLGVPYDLHARVIDQQEAFKRTINNAFYDEVNMGTENFVLATFESFCQRAPTATELQTAVNMCEGNSGVLFLREGGSKEDYMNILLTSGEYYQGQVINLYLRYFLRQPTNDEARSLSAQYASTGDYIQLQRSLLTSDAYVRQ